MKYKGFDSEEFRNVVSNIVEIQESGVWKINSGSVDNAINYFNQKKLSEFGTLIRLAYDHYFVENAVTKLILLDANNKVKSADINGIEELKGLAAFTEEANKLAGVSLAVPVLGEIVTGLAVVFNVINLLSNEPRTRSFNMKDKLIKKYEAHNSYKNLPAGSMERNVTRTTGISMRQLGDLRPKCISPSTACAVEHLRYELRGEFTLNACESIVSITSEYFTESGFKKFIDDYQLIVNISIPKVIQQQQQQTPPVKEPTSGGGSIMPLVAGAIGLYLLNKTGA